MAVTPFGPLDTQSPSRVVAGHTPAQLGYQRRWTSAVSKPPVIRVRPVGVYSAWPNAVISCVSSGVRGRGRSPRASLSAWTWWRMESTISGLAKAVTSPTSAKLEMPAITRRMIFPDRGGACPRRSTHVGVWRFCRSLSRSPPPPSLGDRCWGCGRVRGRHTFPRRGPRSSSITGTAAASATSVTVRLADSSSLVPSRRLATSWPSVWR